MAIVGVIVLHTTAEIHRIWVNVKPYIHAYIQTYINVFIHKIIFLQSIICIISIRVIYMYLSLIVFLIINLFKLLIIKLIISY